MKKQELTEKYENLTKLIDQHTFIFSEPQELQALRSYSSSFNFFMAREDFDRAKYELKKRRQFVLSTIENFRI